MAAPCLPALPSSAGNVVYDPKSATDRAFYDDTECSAALLLVICLTIAKKSF